MAEPSRETMNNWTRIFSIALAAGGVLMIAIAVLTSWLGLASLGTNLKQLLLIAVGGVLVLAALALGVGKPRSLSAFVSKHGAALVLVSLAAALCFGYLVGSLHLAGRTQEYLSRRSFISALPLITPPPTLHISTWRCEGITSPSIPTRMLPSWIHTSISPQGGYLLGTLR